MKLYYVLEDIQPNNQSHFLAEDGSPDMSMPVWFKAQVIDWKTAQTIKELHGKGLTAVVEVETVFSLTRTISFLDSMGCTHSHRYYIPAL